MIKHRVRKNNAFNMSLVSGVDSNNLVVSTMQKHGQCTKVIEGNQCKCRIMSHKSRNFAIIIVQEKIWILCDVNLSLH